MRTTARLMRAEDTASTQGGRASGSTYSMTNTPFSTPSRPIYLDHHATTPVDPRVAQVVLRAMTENFGNANSVDHLFGEAAAELVRTSSEAVGELVGADPEQIRYTSGSTEAIRLAFKDALSRRRGSQLRVAVSRVEHKAVLDVVEAATRKGLAEIAWIEVDDRARLSWESFDSALHSGVDLVCVMAANNEVGTIYPVPEIAVRAHAAGSSVLVDATQAAGRIALSVRDCGFEYLVLSAHKMYGPKGVGALITTSRQKSDSVESGHNGTPNVPGIAGLGEACRLRRIEMRDDEGRVAALRDRLEAHLKAHVPQLVVNGDIENRLSNNLHISIPNIPNDAVVGRLRRTVALSTGAACTTGTQAPSHVLRAMRVPETLQEGALRIGLGRFNTSDEIDVAGAEIVLAVKAVATALRLEAR